MSGEQRRRKVHNLLQEFRRAGGIANQGSRQEPRWVGVAGSSTESGLE